MKFLSIIVISIFWASILTARTLNVGADEKYSSIQSAAIDAKPGDTILVKEGIYQGGMYIENLKGNENNYIHIIGEAEQEVIIRGGSNAIQLTDPRCLVIENLIFEQQTGNGLNIDDGGSYNTPASRVKIQYCTFIDMNASGNNDLLKLSGLDTFDIVNCVFENGAAGGSGVDMVGCHNGRIETNVFKNLGSNAIQAKGGTQYILIQGNYFDNCGQRTLNLGGSTGLQFFRPIDAKFEAADIAVWSNVFIGSVSPINYVGSVRVDVTNNTIIQPEKWVIRILQENVDENRFYKCSQGIFHNNLMYIGNLSTTTNIGPNTAPEDFSFKNNFWYNFENTNWQGPSIPTPDGNQIININPNFINFDNLDFNLSADSKARAYISGYKNPTTDFFGNPFVEPRSAGAIETIYTSVEEINNSEIFIYPNPSNNYLIINLKLNQNLEMNSKIKIYSINGKLVKECYIDDKLTDNVQLDTSDLKSGLYIIRVGDRTEKFLKLD